MSFFFNTLVDLEQIIVSAGANYAAPLKNSSSMGEHIRHCLEFMQEFLNGFKAGTINYDLRKRDKILEKSSQSALEKLKEIAKDFQKLCDEVSCQPRKEPKDLKLKFVISPDVDRWGECLTTFERELLFLAQHNLHHLATLKVSLGQSKDIRLPKNIGVAPSTQFLDKKIS